MQREYTTCEIRKFLQQLFPHRQLVLSQFTFYNHIGVTKPSGNSFKRGRQCYLAGDILPIVVVLALKEEGIPLKNIGDTPLKIQQNIDQIFYERRPTRLMGYGSNISLNIEGQTEDTTAIDAFLSGQTKNLLFWNIDISELVTDLCDVLSGQRIQQGFRVHAA